MRWGTACTPPAPAAAWVGCEHAGSARADALGIQALGILLVLLVSRAALGLPALRAAAARGACAVSVGRARPGMLQEQQNAAQAAADRGRGAPALRAAAAAERRGPGTS